MANFDHLEEETRGLLSRPIAERYTHCGAKLWYDYRKGKELLDELRKLRDEDRQHRPDSRLILAPSNNGKSFLLKRLMRDVDITSRGDSYQISTLLIELPPSPTYSGVCADILEALHHDDSETAAADQRRRETVGALKTAGVRMLLVDEAQNLESATARNRSQVLNLLKYLTNDRDINVICAGNQSAAKYFKPDSAIANRFIHEHLPPWSDDEDYRRWLSTFESRLPLNAASNLHDDPIAKPLLDMSKGLVGAMSRYLVDSAREVLGREDERITPEILQRVKKREDDRKRLDREMLSWPDQP